MGVSIQLYSDTRMEEGARMPYCRECGTELNASDRFCRDCGASVEAQSDKRQSAPRSDKADVKYHEMAPGDVKVRGAQLAGIGYRFAAQIVDGIIMIILFLAIASKIAAKTGGLTDTGFKLEGEPALLAFLLMAIAVVLYFSVLEAFWNGQTLGKKLVGIRVVETNGAPCGFLKALVRNIVRFVDAIAFYLVAAIAVLTSKRNQRLGDMVAGTLVIKRDRNASA